MVKRGSQALTFGLAYLVWLLLMWDISPASLTIGLIVALAAAAIHGPQLTGRPEHAILGRRAEPARIEAVEGSWVSEPSGGVKRGGSWGPRCDLSEEAGAARA